MGREWNRGFILKKLIVTIMIVFSTLTFAVDKTFTDIATAPEVLVPVIVGSSFAVMAAPLIFADGMAMGGKIFTAAGLATIVTGVAIGGIMYALDN